MFRLISFLLLFFSSFVFAQEQTVDPNRLDSLKRSIEENRKNIRAEQELVLKKQDSLLRAAQNSISTNEKINQAAGREEAVGIGKESATLPYLSVALILLAGIIIFILLRRKQKPVPGSPGS